MEAKLPFCMFLLLFPGAMGGKYNVTSPVRESWILDKDFETLINLSFPLSTCSSIYLSDEIDDVEEIFNQFRRIYPYKYTLRRKSYDCQGYFLLGPTDEEIARAAKRVPSLISSTEILIIVNGYVNDNSSIFDVSTYGNANTNIASRSGLWSLSENYLKPRAFKKIDRYEDMGFEYRNFNLRGRELQVSTFYRPPFSYVHTTVNKTIDGAEVQVFPTEDENERDGIEMKLFFILAEKLNFTWTLRKPEGAYRYGRRYNKTEWRGGIIQMLLERKIDMAFGGIWITEDHNLFVNLTEPWYQLFIHFLVPRPQPTTSFWALTRPFSEVTWLFLIFTLLLTSSYMYGRAWIDPKFPKRYRSFPNTLTELIGRLLSTSMPKPKKNVRFHMVLWQTAGWLIVVAYSSSLAARLASSEYESRIDTVRQFLEANLSWGRKGPLPPFHDYFDLTDPLSGQLPGRYRHVETDQEMHEYIMRGKFAVIGKIVDRSFFPEDEISIEDLKRYRVMKEIVGQFYASFAVQPWLLKPMNTMILWMKEAGITLVHLRDVLRRRAGLHLREVLVEHDGNDGSARVLGLTPFGAGFAMLLVGLLISSVVFFFELKRAARSSSIREVLREIERKRRLREAVAKEIGRTNVSLRRNRGRCLNSMKLGKCSINLRF